MKPFQAMKPWTEPLQSPMSLDPDPGDVLKLEPETWIWREQVPGHPARIVKLYRHRGAHYALHGRLSRSRAEREYRRLLHLVRHDVPCTRPLGWAQGYSRRHGFYNLLVTQEIEGAVELTTYLREQGPVGLSRLFGLARRMHDTGLCHQVLYIRNVLVSLAGSGKPGFHIMDLPRSWVFPGSIVGTPPALLDLRFLVHSMRRAGVPETEIPVGAYARNDEPRLRSRLELLLEQEPRRFSKLERRLLDLQTRLRWSAGWARRFLMPAERG